MNNDISCLNVNCVNNLNNKREHKGIKLTIDNLENNIFINGITSTNINCETNNTMSNVNKLMSSNIDTNSLINNNSNLNTGPNLSKFKLK